MTKSDRFGKQDDLRFRHAAIRGAYASVAAAATLRLLRVGVGKLPIRHCPVV